jgi:hypothetical protein
LACIAELEAAENSGDYADDETPVLGEICIDFYYALTESRWSETLRPDEAYYIDRAGLEALIELGTYYETPPAQDIATGSLTAIVDELKPFVPDEEPSLWDRFVDWFDGLFESGSDEGNWFTDWFDSFSLSDNAFDNIVRIITFVAVLAVLAILVNELRLGGAFIRRRQLLRPLAPGAARIATEAPIDLDAVMQAPTVRRKVELMLSLVVSRLQQRHSRALHRSKTHRELVASAGELGPELGEPFADVVRAAERVTYSSWEPDDDELGRVLESGKTVVARAEDDADPA